jgi:integrase/recombinase XerD
MSPLRHALVDYLAVRRALGFKLQRAEKLLDQFLTYVERCGETHLRLPTMLAWASPPGHEQSGWPAYRLSIVRRFACHLQAMDPATEVPAADLLPSRYGRATPYLYSDDEVAKLLAGAATLRTSYRVATYRTLIRLLVVTGMRVGEALALDRDDVDVRQSVLTIRYAKFGKSRELPVHPSTVAALRQYLEQDGRPRAATKTAAVFVSLAGTRLRYCNVHWTFHRLVRRAGLTPRSATCRPRIHDLRHRFAVCTLLDGYRAGEDAQARLHRLSTYLGHVDPTHTYWYLSAAPELLQLASDRLQRHLGGGL